MTDSRPETIDELIRSKVPQPEDATVLVLPVVMFVVSVEQYEQMMGEPEN